MLLVLAVHLGDVVGEQGELGQHLT
jgi:hypothetical protein